MVQVKYKYAQGPGETEFQVWRIIMHVCAFYMRKSTRVHFLPFFLVALYTTTSSPVIGSFLPPLWITKATAKFQISSLLVLHQQSDRLSVSANIRHSLAYQLLS